MTQLTQDQYCVFGNPIEHSRSPFIHHAFARQTKQNLFYQKTFVVLDGFAEAVVEFIDQGGKGANITVPFKEQALALADVLSERATLAGAVNTLSFKNGKIYGDNTDGEGLVQDLIRNKVTLSKSRILLLGAGGAARGVLLPLLAKKTQSITIANRTVSKAEELCRHFDNSALFSCSFEQCPSQEYDLIINATSASLSGGIPAISATIINKETICYDMVYGKQLTPFLLWAKNYGAKQVIDGLGMLVGQAAVSFATWRNVAPETTPVIEQLRVSLENEKVT
ncbi:MAG: shikimate dehydrogenase [Colwellia sp.]|nr:shikimate dehydrogenase [Colwellia sp.]